MKLRLLGNVSACLFGLVATLSSASVGQPLEGRLLAIPDGTEPVAVWVVAIGLIGLVGIARRKEV